MKKEKYVAAGNIPEVTANLKWTNFWHRPCNLTTFSQSSHFPVCKATDFTPTLFSSHI